MNSTKTFLRLDPRAELILLAIVNIIAFTFREPFVELTVILLSALLLTICGCGKSAFKWLVVFACLLLIQYFLLPIMPKVLAVMVTILTVFARKIFPCFMVGSMIIQTTPVRYFIGALRKWKVPQVIIIPLAVTLRYFPAIAEEHRHIRDAMKLKHIRGIGKKIECNMIPLLVSAIKTSDELSAAAITRGIENPCEKTSAVDLRFHFIDYFCIAVSSVIAVYTIFIG